jgi:coenzyme F420-reducing hydrogenase gamma subunit
MKYLGIEPERPRIAVFDFTGCEGCALQLVNKEETLAAFLAAVDIVRFREVTSEAGEDYEIALVEGAISRDDEVERLQRIRERTDVLVALGSCACFAGVNKLKNAFDLDEVNREVYGEHPKATLPVRPIGDLVSVDLSIPGCPVSKSEVERVIQHLIWGVPYKCPVYQVCFECKQRFTVCMFDKGQLCLGPITCGGCEAPCPAAGLGCWGCRGPAAEPNYQEFFRLARERGFSEAELVERLAFFGGFDAPLEALEAEARQVGA